jgi:hypothetical protein
VSQDDPGTFFVFVASPSRIFIYDGFVSGCGPRGNVGAKFSSTVGIVKTVAALDKAYMYVGVALVFLGVFGFTVSTLTGGTRRARAEQKSSLPLA